MTKDNDIVLDESTEAANTLKPKSSGSNGIYKMEMIGNIVQILSQLGSEDLSNYYNRTKKQWGHEADGVGKAKVPMGKLSVKEEVAEIFAGQELSEEFMTKAETIFEAALNARLALETVAITEKLEEEYTEAVELFIKENDEKIEQYLEYAIENWVAENKVSIESVSKSAIQESFLGDLRSLFLEYNVISEEDENGSSIIDKLVAEKEELESKLNEAIELGLEMESIIEQSKIESVIDEVTEGMISTDAAKLSTLAEGISYDSVDNFKAKVLIIKEQYFGADKKKEASTGLINEDVDNGETPAVLTEDQIVKGYSNYYSKYNK